MKKSYESPAITFAGTVESLTAGNIAVMTQLDKTFVAGTKVPVVLTYS